MRSTDEILEKLSVIGLTAEPKHHFVLGPAGLPITESDKNELDEIGRAAVEFVKTMDRWYSRSRSENKAGSWLAGVINSVIPKSGYRTFPHGNELPATFMVDTVWTSEGWRVVEVDVTNRNAMGYPLVMRYAYDLPSIWRGIDTEWRAQNLSGVTQIMADHHRYYEPYFRFFLDKIGGTLVRESELEGWLNETESNDTPLLDLPIMYKSREHLPRLLALAAKKRIAIPPKHYLSSKALATLPWEMNLARSLALGKFLPEGRLVCRTRPLPSGDFFLKFLQSGGAHGTFYNDRAKLEALHEKRHPRAIWQKALPIATRRVAFLGKDMHESLTEGDFYIRVSIFVNLNGEVVDADATCSPDVVVHGSKQSIMTVPVLE